jgi:hypothetical protein
MAHAISLLTLARSPARLALDSDSDSEHWLWHFCFRALAHAKKVDYIIISLAGPRWPRPGFASLGVEEDCAVPIGVEVGFEVVNLAKVEV